MAPIDYTGHTRAFRRHRTLSERNLAAWRIALLDGIGATELPSPLVTRPVADVGCGTGQFLEPLRDWFDVPVLGVEVSAAMRADALAAGLPRGTDLVAGRAEQLPLRTGSIGLAWLSTVIHQLDDRHRALTELHRALADGGVVAIRGYCSDLPVSPLLDLFPGIGRAMATFPSTDQLAEDATRSGFGVTEAIAVEEVLDVDRDGALARIRATRRSDSMLVPLADDEIEAGLEAIAAHLPAAGTTEVRYRLRLLILRK